MAQINKSSEYFNTVLYSGNDSTNNITGAGFQPDWVWTKKRSASEEHVAYDSVRGVHKYIKPNLPQEESDVSSSLTSFDSDGFTLGTSFNVTGSNYVAWLWKASGTTASNTDGSITSTVSANTTSGFSIVSYTGTGANATVGHGLGVAPKMIICKSRTQAQNWAVYHSSLGATKAIFLDGTGGEATSASYWNNTSPTSTVFTVGSSGDVNYNAGTQISYCFAEKKGFSKFGKYTGNGSATDGTFVYTGFKPAFVITKSSSTGGTYYNWGIFDNTRAPYNQMDATLAANLSSSENDGANIGNQYIDFLSNGFKMRKGDVVNNSSGVTYIYMAFAENPLVGTNNIPATAR